MDEFYEIEEPASGPADPDAGVRHALDALDVALSGREFTAADLACEAPAALVRTLWGAGFLERTGG